MPSPPKDRPTGRLLAALRPSRAGPLPVQTGFPTSLADLVVKNHGRLKKQPYPSPSSKRGAAPSPSPSTSPSPSPSPPPASPPPPPPAAAVTPSDQPRPDLSPAQAVCRRGTGCGLGLGLGFLAVSGVVSLALLVIWSKKVVAAVTVASFSLFLIESVRASSLPRRPRPVAIQRQLYLEGRGRVSPIREVEAETEPSMPSCSDSDRGTDASSILAVEERSGVLDESSDRKAKTKKRSWKKLIVGAKKLHKGRKNKETPDSSGSFRSEISEGNAEAAESSDSRRGMANQADSIVEDAVAVEPDSLGSRRSKGTEIDAEPVEIDEPADADLAEEEGDKTGIRFPALVLVAVVLVGLVAGKLPAVAFTLLCAAFLSSVQRLPSGGGNLQRRRLELSVS